MRLLLVEDERELSQAVKRVLEYHKYSVDVAYDGQQALDMVDPELYDGIIMDVMMPRVDGITAVKRIRERGIHTPILMLTAKAEVDDKVLGLDVGADDYLTKPFAVKELLARIRALLRRKGEVAVYTIGNTTLDPESFTLKALSEVRLSNKEYRLMEYLINNKNAYSSTEKLMENVWDWESDAEINTVWVFVSTLRKKMEGIGSDYTIKASRGIGYRLEKK
ncbi:MAG: response regulator transcription factor [Clostridia bacterium]|nr:response regulator transcription factor [Clostridia bacterium]